MTACGGSPTSSSDEGGEGAAASLDEVYAELEGLEGQERTDKLVELAKAEEDNGDFTIYLTTNERESEFFLDGFEEKYDITPVTYRASSTDLQQRLVQEADANYQDGADLVMTNEPEMYQLDEDTKLFLPLKSPMTAAMRPEVVHDNWVGYSANAFVVAWNSKAIDEDEAPESFEDVFTNYQGRTVMEITDWEWFGSLVTQYFMGELGWSEDKAVDLFRQLAAGSAVADGHTLMNTMVIAGEYDISVASYFNRTQGDVADDAPIAWEPAVTPMLVRPAAEGIHKFADRPATALLFSEYMLTDAQQMMAENNFIPMMTEGAPDPLEGYDVIFQDTAKLIAEEDHWGPLYEEVLREAKGEVKTEEE